MTHRVEADANAAQVAAAMVAKWQEIDAVLAPIVGPRGVAALFKRSLYLASSAYPWLAGAPEGIPTVADPEVLKSVFARQGGDDAAAASAAVLRTFHELLVSLIGSSLTEQLLHSVWTPSSSGTATQDRSP